jgi:GPH family glycoside/pentoside/hexuronide:cation symporter
VNASPSQLSADKLPVRAKAAYALGGTTDIFGHWLYNDLANLVFNVFCGLAPSKVGLVVGLTRLVDAFTDPLFGWLSDNTRSRWGRRRPYIIVGSILSGIALPFLFMASPTWSADQLFWFMLISASLFAPVISAYNMPYQSLGAELTPDYHERTAVMSWKAVIQKLAGMFVAAAAWIATLDLWMDPATGKVDIARGAMVAGAIAGLCMIVAGVANFLFVSERYYGRTSQQAKVGFLMGFKRAFTSHPYIILLVVALLYAVPMGISGTLGFYAGTYYTFAGNLQASTHNAMLGGIAYALFGIAGVPFVARLSRQVGKRHAIASVLFVGILVQLSSWWLLTPDMPWLRILFSGLNGLAATGFWVILPSMGVDVVDHDELLHGERLEGAFAAARSWIIKVSMSLSMVVAGVLVEWTGFDRDLGGTQLPETLTNLRLLFALLPAVALTAAFLIVWRYPLTQQRMAEIRIELEQRRGQV